MGRLIAEIFMFHILMKHIPDSIYFKEYFDNKFCFTMVSNAKAEKYGRTPEGMVGKTDYDFLPFEEAQKAHEDDLQVFTTGKAIMDKIEKITRPDGKISWVSVSKIPWTNEKQCIIGVIGVSRDVTRRIEIEQHIVNMLGIIGHDIRSPLLSISASLDLLQKNVFGELPESVKQMISDIANRTNCLEKMVASYLHKTSVLTEIKLPKKEIIDLREDVVDPILEELSDEILEKRIMIDNQLGSIPGGRIKIKAHKTWLQIAYRNLFKNAISHGSIDNPSPVISFGFEEKEDHYVLNVFNNGKPVPLHEENRIFDKFFQGEDSKKDGLGLGLYSIRELIRKHGGEMWYETTHSGFPNFIFTLPK